MSDASALSSSVEGDDIYMSPQPIDTEASAE